LEDKGPKDAATAKRRRAEKKKAAQSGGLRLEELEKCARQQRATEPTGGSEVWK